MTHIWKPCLQLTQVATTLTFDSSVIAMFTVDSNVRAIFTVDSSVVATFTVDLNVGASLIVDSNAGAVLTVPCVSTLGGRPMCREWMRVSYRCILMQTREWSGSTEAPLDWSHSTQNL